MDKPLVKVTFLFILGLVLGKCVPLPSKNAFDLFGLTLVITLLFYLLWKNFPRSANRRIFLFWVGIAIVSSGIFWYARAPIIPSRHIVHFVSPRPVTVIGTIRGDPVFKRHSARFVLKCQELKEGKENKKATGLIQVIFHGQVKEVEPILQCGNRVRIESKITLPEERGNPGETSRRERLASRKIYVQMRIYRSGQVSQLSRSRSWSVICLAVRLKHKLQQIIRLSLPDTQNQPGSLPSVLLEALMLGEKEEIPYQIRENFRAVGVIHTLVVSGLHVGFIWLLGNFIFGSLPLRWRHGLIIPLIVTYVLITGARTPTARAGLMACVYSLAFILNQPRNILTTIAFSALCLVLYNPFSLFQAGFQLSFLIVVVIITLSPVISSWLRFLPQALRPWLAVPLAAQLGAFPLVAYYFHYVSPLAFVTNLLVIPLVGAIVSLGFVAVVAGLLAPSLAWIINFPNRTLILLLIKLVGWFSRLTWAQVRVSCFPLLWVIIWYLLLLGIARWRLFRSRWKLAVGGVALLIIIGWGALNFHGERPALQAVFFNGESGNFTILREANGTTLLIASDDDRFGEIKEIVSPFLFQNKIRQIDYLILTQANLDHLNVLSHLLKTVKISTVLDHPLGPNSPSYPRFRQVLKKNHIRYRRLCADDSLKMGKMEFTIIWPRSKTETTFNLDKSLVSKLRFGNITFLFPSQIGTSTQEELVRLQSDLRATVLKVPSKGSLFRIRSAFLQAVDPAYALLIQGQKYFGRYPRDCGAELRERGAEVHRTSEEGCIIVETDGEECRVLSTLKK